MTKIKIICRCGTSFESDRVQAWALFEKHAATCSDGADQLRAHNRGLDATRHDYGIDRRTYGSAA